MTCPPCTNDCNEGRNCPARSERQEPVAWHYPDGSPDQCTTDKAYAEKEPAWTPMYYKHEWVGLTPEDWEKVDDRPYAFHQAVAWTENRLRVLNT